MNIKGLFREVKDIKATLQRTNPARAPGVLTNATTRGTTRKPVSSTGGEAARSKDFTPRWG